MPAHNPVEADTGPSPAGALNVWPATFRRRVFQGDFTQYHVDWGGGPSSSARWRWTRWPRARRSFSP